MLIEILCIRIINFWWHKNLEQVKDEENYPTHRISMYNMHSVGCVTLHYNNNTEPSHRDSLKLLGRYIVHAPCLWYVYRHWSNGGEQPTGHACSKMTLDVILKVGYNNWIESDKKVNEVGDTQTSKVSHKWNSSSRNKNKLYWRRWGKRWVHVHVNQTTAHIMYTYSTCTKYQQWHT